MKYFYDNREYGSAPTKGDLTKVENWLDSGGGNPTTYFKYDDFGNLYTQTDALGRTTTRDYGIRDVTHAYPDRITNPLGHAIDYEYDVGTGNIIRYTKHGVSFDYEYDMFGRITKDIDPYDTADYPTKKYEYFFDGNAPETIKVSQKTTSNNTLNIYYVYDGLGNLIQVKSPAEEGQQVVKSIFYDGLGRVKEEQNPFFSDFSLNLTIQTNASNKTRYFYDAIGRVTSVINPDGTFINTTYNQSIINDYDANGNRHTYILDSYGRIIEVREYNTDYYIGDNQTYNTTYGYNSADELVGIQDNYGNTFNFTYDSLGRKIRLKDPDLGTWKYEYDFAGNLISQVGGGGNLVTGDNYYREYNGLGQLIRVRDGNNISAQILEEYFYDSNGDRIKINRYSYTGGTNETIYTPYKEWMQIKNSSGSFNFHYIYQGDALVARLNPDGSKWFYHSDHLGSTSSITDENGNVVENEFYSPFGESLSTNAQEENKLYTGQFKDTTGMYYYGARYYLPEYGKFGQCDKIKPEIYNPQQMNCYSYGLNNPFKYFDWNGNVAIIFEGAEGERRQANPNSGVSGIYGRLDDPTKEIYGPGVSASEGYDFIKKSLSENPNQPVVIIGHSRGGGKALEVQKMLQDEGINVDKVYTIDPFSRDQPHVELFKNPPLRAGVNMNYYETLSFIGGTRLIGGENIKIWSPHTFIDSNNVVQDQIVSGSNTLYHNFRYSSQGGKPIISSSGKVTLGNGGAYGNFKCYVSSCSATKAYKKPTITKSKGG